jgi:TolB-like protein/DNA-binding winged helix-turn-helix (wHTH) protein/Tfp pilus assembly protein PilF
VNRAPATIRFGPYEVRSLTRELYKRDRRLRLRPQPFQVLQTLLEHGCNVVTREELRQLLWPSDTFVDFEHGLNTSVKELRAALGDSATEPRYIETLPRLGYRIMVPVHVNGASSSGPENLAGESILGSPSLPLPTNRRWALFLTVSIVLILAFAVSGAFLRSRSRSHSRGQPSNQRLMLAVLPFQNLTGDTAQEYFSDGLTEEMIAQLGRVEPDHLGVIARTSVMHYKNKRERLDQIARDLGVQYVLEGSVRRDSNKVRITAQLIQMRDQTPVWTEQYDRDVSNVLSLQGEIAQQIADEIQITLGDHPNLKSPARHPPLSPTSYEVYDLYLKGRYFWNKRTSEGFERAIECFQQAVEKDPNYAPAYAGLADSYAIMSGYGVVLPKDVMPKARAAAQRAVALDDKLAEAHVSLAVIAQNYDWDWATAQKEYRRSIELDPNYATAHHWYAECLALLGRFNQAFAEIARARQLDPLSLIMDADNGAIFYFSRQYDRSIEQFRAVLDMEPNFPRAQMLVFPYVEKGMYADALAELDKWQQIQQTPWSLSIRAYVLGRSGQQVQARQKMSKLEQITTQPIDPLAFALAYVGINDKKRALFWLERAYAEHSSSLTALKVDPIYDSLRNDPRFQDLLGGIHLAQ